MKEEKTPILKFIVTTGPYKGDTAQAYTKAEARAKIKKKYGLPRLPTGTKIEIAS